MVINKTIMSKNVYTPKKKTKKKRTILVKNNVLEDKY